MDQKGLFSLEAAIGTGQVSQVRELPEAPWAQGNCREVREGLCDSNFGSSEGNSHSLQITVSVSMRDSSEVWMRTRDWLTF